MSRTLGLLRPSSIVISVGPSLGAPSSVQTSCVFMARMTMLAPVFRASLKERNGLMSPCLVLSLGIVPPFTGTARTRETSAV
ncbi:hypothetical protein FH608_034085 [Nonomuraea phyllanthi]|uniref:Uncharacterized protein n=1 Tax=Nonomuraea phyllanthi TaxID=2219224 RepID=A0A5C4VXM7_9ACTN|nr:hypothetical protein FH608_034085 [Nonomuraea phyllanthi]